jgi:hypothetical protein
MSHYGTLVDATTYFTTRRLDKSDLWSATASDRKTAALTEATQLIEMLNFIGERADEDQELEFPRGDDTAVPTDIEYATYEVAYNLLDGRDPDVEIETLNSAAQSIGPSRNRKDMGSIPYHVLHGIPSERAWRLLLPYLRSNDDLVLRRVN